MTAARLLLDLLNDGLQFWVEGGELCFRGPKGALTPERREQLRGLKAEIVSLVGTRGRLAVASFAQQRLWLFEQLVPHTPIYHVAHAIRWQGPLNEQALTGALAAVVERHEALRTVFATIDDHPVQVILAAGPATIPVTDLRSFDEVRREQEVDRQVKAEAVNTFDLTAGPLLRVSLLHVGEREYVLSVTVHHLVTDGWSMGILVGALTEAYRALNAGQPCPLPRPVLQYADYAYWHHRRMQGDALDSQLAYWRKKLEGADSALELPTQHSRKGMQTFRGGWYNRPLPVDLGTRLQQISRTEDATLFMTLLAAFQCLLARYTGRTDIALGSPIAGRTHSQVESLIGFFVNVLVLRTDLSGDPTFHELLSRVKETTLGAYAHQELPAERLAEALHLRRDPSRPLIPVAFVLQNVALETVHVDGVTLAPLEPATDTAKIDLTVFVYESQAGLELRIEYNADLFDEAVVAGVAADYEAILESIAADPDQRISRLPAPSTVLAGVGREPLGQPTGLAEIYERSNLTMNQLLVWSGQRLQRDLPLYNVAGLCDLRGRIDLEHFRRAFRKLVGCSDALRTVFREVDGIPVQTVLPDMPAGVESLDWSDRENGRAMVDEWATERCRRPFDPERCLFDCALIKLGDDAFVWYFCHHHLITDGWSYMLILRYTSDLYERSLRGELDAVPPFEAFQNYVAQEREYRVSSRFAKDKEYWEAKFAEPAEAITFYGRSPVKKTTRVHRVSLDLGFDRTARIKETLARFEISLPMLFTVVVFALLHRISGSSCVSIGIPFHNRRSRNLRTVIGLLMEAVLLRVRTGANETFLSLLEKIKADMFETIRHGSFAIGNPRHRNAYDVFLNYHSTSAEAVNEGMMTGFDGATGSVEWVHTGHDFNSLAIHIHDFESTGSLAMDFDFHCDVFDEDARKATLRHCLSVLDACIANPNAVLGNVDILAADEHRQILSSFNSTSRPYELDRSLHELIEAQAARTPDATAVVFEGSSLTYAELDRRANQLARYLQSLGVGPEVLVGICVERSVEVVVGLLGILKAGGAYVPIDPTYPRDRLAYMLADSAVPVLLTQARLVDQLPEHGARTVCLDRDWATISSVGGHSFCAGGAEARSQGRKPLESVPAKESRPGGAEERPVDSPGSVAPSGLTGSGGVDSRGLRPWLQTVAPAGANTDGGRSYASDEANTGGGPTYAPGGANAGDGPAPVPCRTNTEASHLAYMIYTSGSTGRPKGAMNEHRAIVNRLLWMQETYGLTAQDRILQKTPFSFDVSVWEFFWPLMTGATLVVARPEGHKDAAYLAKLIQQERITTIHFVPSMLEVFLNEPQAKHCESLKRIICSGEALSWDLKEKCQATLKAGLHNLYGPTEAAVDVTFWPCDEAIDRKVVPIGRPVANTRIYILDRYLQPVPIGVSGELYIAGIQVGRGYRQRPELTGEKFVPDPFSETPGARMYRTGDLARHLPNGAIEYLGRLDDQVKIRGFRIELGEIEARIREQGEFSEATVVARDGAGGDKQLVAYVVPRDGHAANIADLRGFLKDRLPEYMVPSFLVELKALPLSPNGKLDRKALPEPKERAGSGSRGVHVPPRNPLEKQLVDMWEEALGIRPIGVTDNFFDLGGHSLVAVRMMSQLNRQSEREIPVAVLFESPTIETLARLLTEPDASRPWSPLVSIQPSGSRPPLFCVHALFGSVLCFIELARALGSEQPLFGLQSIGAEGGGDPLERIEDMAVAYIEAVRTRQPRGPYHLAGYSLGGVIAYEMARQLRRQGEDVALLALFDAYTPKAAGVEGVNNLTDAQLLAWFLGDRDGWLSKHNPELAGRLAQMGPDEQMAHLLAELQKTGHIPPHIGIDRMDRYLRVLNANLQAFHRYRPDEYDGAGTFFRSEGNGPDDTDPLADWHRLFRGGLRVHRVPGFHGTMLSPPHVQVIGHRLDACLRECTGSVSR